MIVKWPQLKRLLKLDEMIGADISYTIPDHLVIRVLHSDFDGGIYTATHAQVIGPDEYDEACLVIQVEGQPDEPVSVLLDQEINVEVYRQEQPKELFWPA